MNVFKLRIRLKNKNKKNKRKYFVFYIWLELYSELGLWKNVIDIMNI